jgi:hypothetical protein
MFAALLLAPLLVFHGNVALLEDVYRSVLDLNGGTKATPANARMVAVRLASFLHRAGYALATVRARVEGEQIVVDIDEGRLDKVIFLGGGAFETLRLRLDLNIEHDVFNQPDLERQLRALGRRLGLGEFAYEIVPVPNVAPVAPRMQLDEIDPLEKMSFGLVRPGRPYELHILVQPGKFRPGLSPELEIDSVEGGAIGATYHSGRLIFQDDRWEVGARVAGAVRQRLDGTGSTFKFTRALGEVQYDAPSITGVFRPSLRARGELTDVQRPDLRLESFMFTRLEGGAHLVFTPTGYVRSSLGGGVERRLLFSVEPASGSVFSSSYKFAHTRQYAEAALELTFDPDNIRRDRHHLLGIDARVYGPPHEGEESALHLTGWYQKTFAFGWNELWVEARGISRTGFVLFPEEASIGGSVLRGPFGNEYARKYGGLDLEFRYSLLRDVIKVGIFHNGVAYGAIDRVTNNEKLTFANAVGLGFHALIIDEFQLDAWYGVGWSTKSVFGFDQGGALAIRQAF